ncbi:MAG: hypothetical protein GXP03_00845 [Alphaproteobacteria bacterium]|nr:hypothetical protein [Alphaproteobacteria bacterium]
MTFKTNPTKKTRIFFVMVAAVVLVIALRLSTGGFLPEPYSRAPQINQVIFNTPLEGITAFASYCPIRNEDHGANIFKLAMLNQGGVLASVLEKDTKIEVILTPDRNGAVNFESSPEAEICSVLIFSVPSTANELFTKLIEKLELEYSEVNSDRVARLGANFVNVWTLASQDKTTITLVNRNDKKLAQERHLVALSVVR